MASSSSSSSSSSSHLHQTKYDVFISFRGSDVRHGFLGRLTKELRQKQIDAYIDDKLERGNEISSALVKAIEESEISLVIFSEDYASSKWCLEELVKIMECKEANHQIVIPVFYNIDPSHVRHQKGTFGDALAQHQQKMKENMDKLHSWRSAFEKVANLSGYHYSSNFESESKFIDEIVKDVLKKLDYPTEPNRLVGFDRNFARVESLLELESQEVRVVGIWGMGGIGKTTLARAVCDKYSSKLESCCFLENVREESKKINWLNHLLHKLYSQLLDEENLNMYNAQAKRFIKRRLSRKKVLIVLDDVDTSMQLQYLSGEQVYLGPGSKVIITSRDKHVLVSGGVHAIHEIKELNFQESLELFSLNAFNQRHPEMGYGELSKAVVLYAKGIPLALKVLGLHLYSRNREAWESAVKKLQKYPNMEIQNVLKVSYEGLEEVEKNIFLDIAFFFKGHLKDDVIWVLDACDFYAASGIDLLLDKALITISQDNKIEMHDLLQEMGEQIVREESIKHPKRRSRLKDSEEIYDVLQNNMGTDAIEGIILDVCQIKTVHLSVDTFKKMPNLRILIMYSDPWVKGSNVYVPFGLVSNFNKLRYFHWDEYALESLPVTFRAEKLVVLRMERSQLKKLWDGVKDLMYLKILNLGGSKKLMELPDFSKARNLEKLQLSDCESLSGLHSSIASFCTLASLELMRCHALKSSQMYDLSSLTSLKHLSLRGCRQVNKMELYILFDSLHCLEGLGLEACNNLYEIPDTISSLSSLKNLYLDESNVESLPSSMKLLPNLEHLSLNTCKRIKSIPELPTCIKFLHAQFCPLLETVVPFKTSVVEDNGRRNKLDFSFLESRNLDEQSAMEFSLLSMMQAIYSNFSNHEVCYPGSRIPHWFRYKKTAEDDFTIELPSSPEQLLGFVFGAIFPQSASNKSCRLRFMFFVEDFVAQTYREFFQANLNKDHVYLWYRPFKDLLRLSEGRKCGESITCRFICEISDEIVPEAVCGVCPIYASQFDNMIEQISESEMAAKSNSFHLHEIDENPDEVQPSFQIKISRESVFHPMLLNEVKGMGLKQILPP